MKNALLVVATLALVLLSTFAHGTAPGTQTVTINIRVNLAEPVVASEILASCAREVATDQKFWSCNKQGSIMQAERNQDKILVRVIPT